MSEALSVLVILSAIFAFGGFISWLQAVEDRQRAEERDRAEKRKK